MPTYAVGSECKRRVASSTSWWPRSGGTMTVRAILDRCKGVADETNILALIPGDCIGTAWRTLPRGENGPTVALVS